MWGRIAEWFGVAPTPFDGVVRPLAQQMTDDGPLWRRMAERDGLAEPDLGRLASPWHTDADLGRPIQVVTDMSKSRRLGFTAYQPTDDAFFDLFAKLRADRQIPSGPPCRPSTSTAPVTSTVSRSARRRPRRSVR